MKWKHKTRLVRVSKIIKNNYNNYFSEISVGRHCVARSMKWEICRSIGSRGELTIAPSHPSYEVCGKERWREEPWSRWCCSMWCQSLWLPGYECWGDLSVKWSVSCIEIWFIILTMISNRKKHHIEVGKIFTSNRRTKQDKRVKHDKTSDKLQLFL